jgi:hypothetical protein
MPKAKLPTKTSGPSKGLFPPQNRPFVSVSKNEERVEAVKTEQQLIRYLTSGSVSPGLGVYHTCTVFPGLAGVWNGLEHR